MSSNTKIVVLRSKELVYALVLLVVSILIIMVAVSVFVPSKDNTSLPLSPEIEETPETQESDTAMLDNIYVPGIYSSVMQLGGSDIELQITVDKNRINSINMVTTDESIETLYPLMTPTLSGITDTILTEQSIDNISYSDENRYTSMLLMKAISDTLDKARISENADTPDNAKLF